MKDLLRLFWTFFKIGAFTFGGGYAMISLIENDVVEKRKWLTEDEMMNIITIAESTPGPISINTATFVGTKVKGVLGALFATVGLVLPSFIIICAISLVLEKFKAIKLIAYALKGIQAGVVVLIFNAFIKFFKNMDKSILTIFIFIVAFALALLTNISVVLIIVVGGVSGVIMTLISGVRAKKMKKGEVTDVEESQNTSENVCDAESCHDADAVEESDCGSNDDGKRGEEQ